MEGLDTWDDLYEDFCTAMISKYKPSTLHWYKGLLKPLIARQLADGVTLQQFTRRHLERYLAEKAKTGGKRYLEVVARCCSIFLRYGKTVGSIDKDPLAGYEIPKAPKAYVRKPTVEDLQKLLQAILDRWDVTKNPKVRYRSVRERRFIKTRDYALICGLIETGCRVTELCQLKLQDFDAAGLQIVFRETKGDEPRKLPISAEWAASVKDWLKVRPPVKGCDTLFISINGVPLNKDTVKNQMNEYEKFGGIPHMTRHSLRHYTLTELARVNIHSAARLAGHKDLRVTEGYLHADSEIIRQDHAAANPLGRLLVKRRAEKPRPKRII